MILCYNVKEFLNGHVIKEIYFGSYEMTHEHLHGPQLKWEYRCTITINPVIESFVLLELLLIETEFRFMLA